MKIAELPAPEVARRMAAGHAVLLPMGSTETHGPGMPMADPNQAFVRRARPGPGSRGLGLGLAIARALVESQCGRLTLESSVGRGTCANLRFVRTSSPITIDAL